MGIKCGLTAILFFLVHITVYGQFQQVYPVSENPSIGWKSSMAADETILFEANPTARFSLYNDFYQKFLNAHAHGQAYYVSYRPQLRMYTDNSRPVRMPSYRILLGTQHLYRLDNDNHLGFSLESGHYSNGQDGCAFDENEEDGSAGCAESYRQISPQSDLSALLNRKDGNFSTNLTELVLNYRINVLDDDDTPAQLHSFKFGAVLYHDRFLGLFDFGGYTAEDIEIYGRYRYLGSYEFTQVYPNKSRCTLSGSLEFIRTPHPHVEPWRTEATVAYYLPNEMGFFASYVYGHDNYNIRFVDSGQQIAVGLSWNMFPLFKIK